MLVFVFVKLQEVCCLVCSFSLVSALSHWCIRCVDHLLIGPQFLLFPFNHLPFYCHYYLRAPPLMDSSPIVCLA